MASVRLRPSVEPFAASTGDIYLLRSDGGGDVVLREATPFVHELVAALAAGHTERLPERLARTGNATEAEVRAALGELEAADLLTHERSVSPREPLSPAEALRYDRQLHYFRDQSTVFRDAWDMQIALRSATVVVLGAGGLGTWAMASLACAGVGRLVAVDDDTVELANLNRQILYRTADIGRLKVDVAGEALRALNPEVDFVGLAERVQAASDVRSAAAGADFLVCTADSPPVEIGRWVNQACLETGLPHIAAGQFPPRVRVGPTFVPGRTGCLACQENQARRAFPLYDELVEQRRTAAPVAATLGAASGLIGSLLAMEVIHWLTAIAEPATLGRGLVFDLRDFSSYWEPVDADPTCPLGCGRACAVLGDFRSGARFEAT
jgi:molybdopterin-synthase adenylyltransferase